jgi:hypothetical protein
MPQTRHPYSFFLRGPSKVLPDLTYGDVILERRDDVNLVLTNETRDHARAVGMETSGGILARLAQNQPRVLVELLAEQLPWLRWLPDDERPQAIDEIIGELLAGASTGNLEPFGFALNEWRETATIWSNPELARRLHGPFPGDGPEILAPSGRRRGRSALRARPSE